MTCRCTIKVPQSPTDMKGFSPEEIDQFKSILNKTKHKTFTFLNKNLTVKEKTLKTKFEKRAKKIDQYNKIQSELAEAIQTKLKGVNITHCNDGCIVLTAEDTLINVEKCIEDLGLEITTDRPEIKHRVKPVSNTPDAKQEEDIDEVLEPKTIGEKKKLKSRKLINKFKVNQVKKIQ